MCESIKGPQNVFRVIGLCERAQRARWKILAVFAFDKRNKEGVVEQPSPLLKESGNIFPIPGIYASTIASLAGLTPPL